MICNKAPLLAGLFGIRSVLTFYLNFLWFTFLQFTYYFAVVTCEVLRKHICLRLHSQGTIILILKHVNKQVGWEYGAWPLYSKMFLNSLQFKALKDRRYIFNFSLQLEWNIAISRTFGQSHKCKKIIMG